MVRRASPWLLLLLAALAGCSRCGKDEGAAGPSGKAASVSRYLPRDAQAAIVVKDLGELGEKLARFQNLKIASFLAQLQNAQSAEALVSAVMRQVGVDLRSRTAMEAAGIAPGKGAGAAFLSGNQAFTVLGVKDAKTLEETFATLARNRLGASERKEEKVAGGTLVTFSRKGAEVPALGLLFVGDFVLLAPGAAVARLPGLATLPVEKSVAEEPVLAASLSRLPKDPDFHVYFPGGTGLLPAGTVQAVTLTGRIEEKSVTVHADAPWPDTEAALAPFVPQKGPELLGYLPADSFLVARYGGDPATLGAVWPYLAGPRLTRAFQESGFDPKTELLDNLQSGIVAGVALAPTAQLGAGVPSLDIRRTNPFRFVHLVSVGEAKDAAKARSTLEKVPGMAAGFGAQVAPEDVGGQRAYLTSYRAGEGAHFAEVGGKLVLAAPRARLEAALTALAGSPGKSPVAEELQDAVKEPVLGVVLDLRKMSEAIKNLPSSAWGVGGFAIRATALRWLEATDDLRAVTLGLSRKDKALQAQLSLQLTPPPAPSSEAP
ncbi:hypothetical protein SAMN05444354_106308 [Stigmatella aurantiaca]|uniref:Lipoprotein n=1 Tax=Stigmatella aurantiaca TaxID=41 RepID=A0A1H7QY62_STIAU|nr:hypothetical protein [Stigmatella aurantiaca]SEL52585.1 hypothetical protein SAMN05444354_106308 [Stigmatella aurantiaca]